MNEKIRAEKKRKIWNYLPITGFFNSYNNEEKGIITGVKTLFHAVYSSAFIMPFVIYGALSSQTGSFKIKEQREIFQEQKEIQNNYNDLFGNAKTFEDSLKIYRENGLSLKLEDSSFEEKEKLFRKK